MNARIPLVSIAFFLSGAAALIYQVTWQRLLALHSGVGIYSVAIIGASSDTRGLRGRIVQIMRSHPYEGAIYPVSRSEIGRAHV